MRTETFYLYEDRTDVTLTSYLLDESPELAKSSARSAIIINPGGAYMVLSDREAEPIAMRFAGMGFQTFVLRYSILTGSENKWPEDVSSLPERRPEAEYPAPLLELGKSMLLVREHAKEWHVNPEQIGICGFSAGGHNVTLYASAWFHSVVTEGLHAKAEDLRPAFCIAGYPFVDWELQYNLEMDKATRDAYRWMYLDYFGTADPSPEKMRECSANYLVTEQTAPTFLWTTSTDQSVYPVHSLRLAAAMIGKQVPCEFHMFGEGHHGLALADEATRQNPDDVSEVVAQWTSMAEKWIRKILK